MKNKILFITHETSRTGAPIVLLYFLKWLKTHHCEIETTVLSLKKGVLHEDFKKEADTYYELSDFKNIKEKFKLICRATNREQKLMDNLVRQNFNLVYSNTVVAIPYGDKIKAFSKDAKHIVHVHELNSAITQSLPNFESYISNIDYIIAASNIVKHNLIEQRKIDSIKIDCIYECSIITTDSNNNKLNENKFVVGGAGSVEWRKGSDLFIQVARYIKTHHPDCDICFKWVGFISNNDLVWINEDLRKCGLSNAVTFVGEQEEPYKLFSEFDVFLMTSREDPFPLVCIELGQLGKPIICFDQATGTAEILENGGGYIVPYLDVEEMAKKIIHYYNNPESLIKDGKKAQQLFLDFTPEQMCPIIFEKIETLLK